jgi:hypothetical protein
MNEIQKQCKQCNNTFTIVRKTNVGSGSANVFTKKQYCSSECKKQSRERGDIGKRIACKCVICGNIRYRPPSILSKTCSRKCRSIHQSNVITKIPIENKICLGCGELFPCPINVGKKSCSHTCHNLQRKLLNVNAKIKSCLVCGITFRTTKKNTRQKLCSKKCQNSAQSSGIIKCHYNGKSGYRPDIDMTSYFLSSFEADYARYCNFIERSFEYQSKTFQLNVSGTNRSYTPDFYHSDKNEFTELKSVKFNPESKFSSKMNANINSVYALKETGIQINILYMNDFYKMLIDQKLLNVIPNIEHKYHKNNCNKIVVINHKDL